MKKINFLIDHIDPLGQGVFKKGENIYFIPKTLSFETGTAVIHKKKKNIHFAYLEELEQESQERIQVDCKHYASCNGCHYLHTNYENEVFLKNESFKRIIKRMSSEETQFHYIQAPRRFHYRNRIQLHYNLKRKQLGFINSRTNQIVPVPNCIVIKNNISEYLKTFYKEWKKLIPHNAPNKGHVELYEISEQIQVNWNKRYAAGGFTQVYQEMNLKLQELVQKLTQQEDTLLDLFGGNGNLSHFFQGFKRIVDFHQEIKSSDQVHLDLFKENALQSFKQEYPQESFSTFIVDPPRKGFPQLKDWTEEYLPKEIIYVSCHPQTMARDINTISDNYTLKEAYMLDLFPGTYHFEGLCLLKRKD